MATKASVQCWDNSTRGLDASTALEYVQSLRRLTNTAKEQARREKNKKNFTIPFHEQAMILTWRQFLVMLGDRQSLAVKWGVVTFQALLIGSLFYNPPKTRWDSDDRRITSPPG